MKLRNKFSLCIFISCLLFALPVHAQDQSTKVKAVFLFKFFDYVTWPKNKDPKYTNKGVICTYGPHNFDNTLEYISAKRSSDIQYQIRKISSPKQAKECHIVYVSPSRFADVKGLVGSNILITSGSKGFLEKGGIIEMLDEKNKVKLRIHLGNARKNDIKISSKLLKIAEVLK